MKLRTSVTGYTAEAENLASLTDHWEKAHSNIESAEIPSDCPLPESARRRREMLASLWRHQRHLNRLQMPEEGLVVEAGKAYLRFVGKKSKIEDLHRELETLSRQLDSQVAVATR